MNAATAKILIADDEPLYIRTTRELLRKAGYECVCVADAHAAIEKLRTETFDLVLSDLNMPGNTKLEFLHYQSEHGHAAPIVVITGVPTLPSAIESVRLGIADYLLKPVKIEDLLACIERVLLRCNRRGFAASAGRGSRSENCELFPHIIGNSAPMRELYEIIDRVSGKDTNILITGESGTGKEIVANTIHGHSHRCQGKFQVIDFTAIPEPLFESMLFGHKKGSFTGAVEEAEGLLRQCDGGTAFFDELGELPMAMQVKLLRAVQEQTFVPVGSHTPVRVDTRFICATNRDLELEIKMGRFRQDLFYRLAVIHISLPPLRDRGEDVLLLADAFLQKLRGSNSPIEGFTAEALDTLMRYSWPGNIRELRNVIERAIAMTRSNLIMAADLPEKVRFASPRSSPSLDQPQPNAHENDASRPTLALPLANHVAPSREEAIEAAELGYLIQLMTDHSGNISDAARQAKISRQGLHRLLKRYGIDATAYRSRVAN